MDLQPGPEQRALAETTHQALSDLDAPAAARRWAEGDPAPGRAIWAALAGAGLPALLVPERHGGLGLGMREVVGCLAELGHHAAPGPWVETVAVAPALFGHPSTADRYAAELARIAAGEAVVTVALAGPAGADPDGAGPELLFPDAGAADLLIAIQPHPAGAERVTGYRSPAPELLRPRVSVDPVRRLATLAAAGPDGAAVPGTAAVPAAAAGQGAAAVPAARRGPGAAAWSHPVAPAAVAAARAAGALGTAAVLLGCGRAAVETAAEYARTRHQFGRPIGEFQAVKHRLADALGGLAFAEPVLHAAALAFDRALPDATRDAATAKLVAADAARSAVTAALQVHGAIGYTDEHPLSLWLRRVTALRAAWGTPDAHRELVAAALAAGDTGHLGQPPDPLPSTTTGATVAAGQEATVAAGRGA